MATKAQIIELVRREILSNGTLINDDLGKVSPRQVALALEQVYADAVFLMLKNSPNDLDFLTKNYNEVDINYDRTENSYYITLPATIVQLPNNGGVRLVKPHGTNFKFYPTSNEDVDLFEGMDVKTHYDRTLYLLDGQGKIKLINFDYASHNIRKVNLKLVVDFGEYAMTDEISIPSGKITEFTSILSKKLFQKSKVLDTSSDGV
jgi:hypothetical protein